MFLNDPNWKPAPDFSPTPESNLLNAKTGRGTSRRFCATMPFRFEHQILPLSFGSRYPILRRAACSKCHCRVLGIDGVLFCWHCHGLYQEEITGYDIPAWPVSKRLLFALMSARPRVLVIDDLIAAVWPDPDLEPDSAVRSINLSLHRLRCVGFNIPIARGGRGGGSWTINEGVWQDKRLSVAA